MSVFYNALRKIQNTNCHFRYLEVYTQIMSYLNQTKEKIFYVDNHNVLSLSDPVLDTNSTKKERPTLVLVHGAGGSHEDWPSSLWQTSKYPVYALNLPGHSYSAGPARRSVAAYAQDVLDFIESLALEKVIIGGHSMGGAIAQTIALNPPPSLVGLILIGTGAKLRVTKTILDGFMQDFPATIDFIVKYGWAEGTPDNLVTLAHQRLLSNDPVIIRDDYAACNAFDIMDQVHKINVPTLVIGGTADKLTTLKYSQYLADTIPKAQLATIENGGHYMALEQSEKVTKIIIKFLDAF